ncbi:hypothetical protein [uncultured Bacteroides sp.]|uniref:hypothetical protein n=1 Tax=uncultured Bacteroides sp. TaxID=162156 RepID=UPI0025D0ADA0|nr:hypothetical protein [uncultured Bacteroides sp.]
MKRTGGASLCTRANRRVRFVSGIRPAACAGTFPVYASAVLKCAALSFKACLYLPDKDLADKVDFISICQISNPPNPPNPLLKNECGA